MSFASSGQKSLILLNKYHCRSIDNPGGGIISGMLWVVGCHGVLRSLISFSVSSLKFFTYTTPGFDAVNQKWCICDIPFSAVCTM